MVSLAALRGWDLAGVKFDCHKVFKIVAGPQNLLVRVLVYTESLCSGELLPVAVGDNLAVVIQDSTHVGVINLLVLSDVSEEVLVLHLGAIRAQISLVGLVVAESAHHLVRVGGHGLRAESRRLGAGLELIYGLLNVFTV